jgi:hypothetical protein
VEPVNKLCDQGGGDVASTKGAKVSMMLSRRVVSSSFAAVRAFSGFAGAPVKLPDMLYDYGALEPFVRHSALPDLVWGGPGSLCYACLVALFSCWCRFLAKS